MLAALLVGCGAGQGSGPSDARKRDLLARPEGPGMLFLVGGGEDRPAIFRKFLALAGGPVVVVPLAAGQPAGAIARAQLESAGAAGVTVLTGAPERLEAERAAIGAARGLWFTGGMPDRLLGAFGPYRAATGAAWKAGCVVGGTSAGAMAWGDRVVVSGESEDGLRRGLSEGGLRLEPGFGLLAGTIVDPHFGARGRFGRLWVATGATGTLGLGVDEETAAILDSEGRLEVYGAGVVTVMRPEAGPGSPARVAIVRSRETLDLGPWGGGPHR